MNTKNDNAARTRATSKTMIFAAGLWAALALALAVATVIPGSRMGTGETAGRDGAGYGAVVEAERLAEERRLAGTVFGRTELYFGSEKPGPDVTGKQFDRFVDRRVTPRFPDGLTLLTGYGQFRESSGEIVQERSFVLILLYPPDDRQANREIQEVRDIYERDFDQESVLRTDSRERVSF